MTSNREIAGRFRDPRGFQQSASGQYYVFDRRAHEMWGIDPEFDGPFRIVEIGAEPGRQAGKCDSGYSCAYSNNISWRNEATAMSKEIVVTAASFAPLASPGRSCIACRKFTTQPCDTFTPFGLPVEPEV